MMKLRANFCPRLFLFLRQKDGYSEKKVKSHELVNNSENICVSSGTLDNALGCCVSNLSASVECLTLA